MDPVGVWDPGEWNRGEHLYRLYEAFEGYPDTRFMRCVACGYSFDGQLEDADEPICDGALD